MLKFIIKGVTLGLILVLAPVKKSEELAASRKNVQKRGKEVKKWLKAADWLCWLEKSSEVKTYD